MRVTKSVRRALLVIALILIGAGLAQMVIGKVLKPTSVRVMAALADLPAGSALRANETGWVEVESSIAGGYLKDPPAPGSILLETVARGEMVPLRVIGSEPSSYRSIVTIKPLVSPVRQLKVGDRVDVWARALPNSASDLPAPSIVATMAQVVAVSGDQNSMGSQIQTIDISIERNQLLATVAAALDSRSVLAVVRTPSLADLGKS